MNKMLGDDLDIYDDLDDFQQAEDKKSKELLAWEEKHQAAQLEILGLQQQNKVLQKKIKTMEVNLQILLDTAKADIKRKDTLIAELRKEKDDMCFRRKRGRGFEESEPVHKRARGGNPFSDRNQERHVPDIREPEPDDKRNKWEAGKNPISDKSQERLFKASRDQPDPEHKLGKSEAAGHKRAKCEDKTPQRLLKTSTEQFIKEPATDERHFQFEDKTKEILDPVPATDHKTKEKCAKDHSNKATAKKPDHKHVNDKTQERPAKAHSDQSETRPYRDKAHTGSHKPRSKSPDKQRHSSTSTSHSSHSRTRERERDHRRSSRSPKRHRSRELKDKPQHIRRSRSRSRSRHGTTSRSRHRSQTLEALFGEDTNDSFIPNPELVQKMESNMDPYTPLTEVKKWKDSSKFDKTKVDIDDYFAENSAVASHVPNVELIKVKDTQEKCKTISNVEGKQKMDHITKNESRVKSFSLEGTHTTLDDKGKRNKLEETSTLETENNSSLNIEKASVKPKESIEQKQKFNENLIKIPGLDLITEREGSKSVPLNNAENGLFPILPISLEQTLIQPKEQHHKIKEDISKIFKIVASDSKYQPQLVSLDPNPIIDDQTISSHSKTKDKATIKNAKEKLMENVIVVPKNVETKISKHISKKEHRNIQIDTSDSKSDKEKEDPTVMSKILDKEFEKPDEMVLENVKILEKLEPSSLKKVQNPDQTYKEPENPDQMVINVNKTLKNVESSEKDDRMLLENIEILTNVESCSKESEKDDQMILENIQILKNLETSSQESEKQIKNVIEKMQILKNLETSSKEAEKQVKIIFENLKSPAKEFKQQSNERLDISKPTFDSQTEKQEKDEISKDLKLSAIEVKNQNTNETLKTLESVSKESEQDDKMDIEEQHKFVLERNETLEPETQDRIDYKKRKIPKNFKISKELKIQDKMDLDNIEVLNTLETSSEESEIDDKMILEKDEILKNLKPSEQEIRDTLEPSSGESEKQEKIPKHSKTCDKDLETQDQMQLEENPILEKSKEKKSKADSTLAKEIGTLNSEHAKLNSGKSLNKDSTDLEPNPKDLSQQEVDMTNLDSKIDRGSKDPKDLEKQKVKMVILDSNIDQGSKYTEDLHSTSLNEPEKKKEKHSSHDLKNERVKLNVQPIKESPESHKDQLNTSTEIKIQYKNKSKSKSPKTSELSEETKLRTPRKIVKPPLDEDTPTPKRHCRTLKAIQIIEDIRLPAMIDIEHIAVQVDGLDIDMPTSKPPSNIIMYAQPDSTKIDHNDDEIVLEEAMNELTGLEAQLSYPNLSLEADTIEKALEQLHQQTPDETIVTSTSSKLPQQDLFKILTQSPSQVVSPLKSKTKTRKLKDTPERYDKTPLKKRKINLSEDESIMAQTPTKDVTLDQPNITIDETLEQNHSFGSDSSTVTKRCSLGQSDYQFERINDEVVLRVTRRGRRRRPQPSTQIEQT